MYASNEDEFNREDEDWIFLHQTPTADTVKRFEILLFFVFN
jgi:hypothetical protein